MGGGRSFLSDLSGAILQRRPENDPTRESLEYRNEPLADWQLSPWTGDWYERADWERRLGDDFYRDGVFHRR